MDKILKTLKSKYLKDKEFKKEFDLNKEKAIEKHFSSKTLKELKANLGNVSESNFALFLGSKELDDKALENIAGGKKEEKAKRVVVREYVPVVVEQDINKVKMNPTVQGHMNVSKGRFNDF